MRWLMIALLLLLPGVQAAQSDFEFRLDTPADGEADVDPGGDWANLTVELENLNSDQRRFKLTIPNADALSDNGIEVWWSSDGDNDLPGQSRSLEFNLPSNELRSGIRVSVEPRTSALYGSHFIELNCHDLTEGDPDEDKQLQLQIDVSRVVDVALAPAEGVTGNGSADIGEATTYLLKVTNSGNSQDTFDLEVDGTSSGWEAEMVSDDDEINLDAHASGYVTVEVTAPSDASYSEMLTVQVTARSQLQGTVSVQLELTTHVRVFQGLLLEPLTALGAGGPGDSVVLKFKVTNKWSEDVDFQLARGAWYMGDTPENTPSGWTFSEGGDTLLGGYASTENARATVSIASGADAGDVVTIEVTAQVGDGELAQTTVQVQVEGDYDIQLANEKEGGLPAPASFNIDAEQQLTFATYVQVKNRASVSDTAVITADFTAGGQGWELDVPEGGLDIFLASEAEKGVLVAVRPPADSQGTMATLEITATSVGDPSSTQSVSLTIHVNSLSDGGGSQTENLGQDKQLPVPIEILVGTVLLIGLGVSSVFYLQQRSRKVASSEDQAAYSDEWGAMGEEAANAAGPAAAAAQTTMPAAAPPAPPPGAAAGPVTVACPGCQTQLQITDTQRPLTVKCPTCATPLTLQAQPGAAP
ncbi:MAG: hypothetical protein VX193_01880, partial [Candidatus Thermoplasmatota archaeon]|nr:hypothetical protein [Candidatus Thermoplasmatota archaeon]